MTAKYRANRRIGANQLIVCTYSSLFCLSINLLLVASTLPGRFVEGQVSWEGIIDVVTAVILAILGTLMQVKAKNKIEVVMWQRSYGIATLLPSVILLLMWVFASKIIWTTLLPGLAWRTWLLLYTLPPSIALWKAH